VLAFAVGASNAMPIVLAQMVGLATNDFTYAFYSKMAELNAQRKVVTTKVNVFKEEHPAVFSDAVEGVKAGIKTFVALVLAFFWILGLPIRIYRWVANFKVNHLTRQSHATA